jgi:hypothetical protein
LLNVWQDQGGRIAALTQAIDFPPSTHDATMAGPTAMVVTWAAIAIWPQVTGVAHPPVRQPPG